MFSRSEWLEDLENILHIISQDPNIIIIILDAF